MHDYDPLRYSFRIYEDDEKRVSAIDVQARDVITNEGDTSTVSVPSEAFTALAQQVPDVAETVNRIIRYHAELQMT